MRTALVYACTIVAYSWIVVCAAIIADRLLWPIASPTLLIDASLKSKGSAQ